MRTVPASVDPFTGNIYFSQVDTRFRAGTLLLVTALPAGNRSSHDCSFPDKRKSPVTVRSRGLSLWELRRKQYPMSESLYGR